MLQTRSRWVLCVLLLAGTTINYLDRQTLSLLAPMMREELGLNNERLGLLFSFFYYAYTAAQFAVGPLMDRANLRWAYGGAVLLWSANDQMALGAMAAIERRGLKLGQDMLVSGVNTSPEAMQAVRQDRLAVLAGGHFMIGAWAVVMLYDLHHGRDFADEGLELERPMFMLFDKALAQRFQARFEPEVRDIDLRPYSKALNPSLKRYDFSLAPLLR